MAVDRQENCEPSKSLVPKTVVFVLSTLCSETLLLCDNLCSWTVIHGLKTVQITICCSFLHLSEPTFLFGFVKVVNEQVIPSNFKKLAKTFIMMLVQLNPSLWIQIISHQSIESCWERRGIIDKYKNYKKADPKIIFQAVCVIGLRKIYFSFQQSDLPWLTNVH